MQQHVYIYTRYIHIIDNSPNVHGYECITREYKYLEEVEWVLEVLCTNLLYVGTCILYSIRCAKIIINSGPLKR